MPRILLILCALILAGCSRQSDAPGDTVPASADGPVETAVSIYRDTLQNPARPETDRARDADRKPAEVLQFLGVMPGMTVLDMFSGGGYYTKILSSVVGDSGRVVAHSNEAEWQKFKADHTNEAILDRIVVVRVPYNLRLSEEVKIYRKFLKRHFLNS